MWAQCTTRHIPSPDENRNGNLETEIDNALRLTKREGEDLTRGPWSSPFFVSGW